MAEKVATYSNRDSGLSVELLHFLDMSRKKRLLDEERLVRLKLASELLGEGLVHTAVEVAVCQVECQWGVVTKVNRIHSQSDVNTDRLDLFQALDGGIESVRGVEPAELLNESVSRCLEEASSTVSSPTRQRSSSRP